MEKIKIFVIAFKYRNKMRMVHIDYSRKYYPEHYASRIREVIPDAELGISGIGRYSKVHIWDKCTVLVKLDIDEICKELEKQEKQNAN